MKNYKILFNLRPLDKILFTRLLALRDSLKLKPESFIPYADIRQTLGRNFSITKSQVKDILNFLDYSGFIESSTRGIKLNFILEND